MITYILSIDALALGAQYHGSNELDWSMKNVACPAFCDDVLVGAIVVRLESLPDGKARLYLITLGVLAAYRSHGIGMAPCNMFLSSGYHYRLLRNWPAHVHHIRSEAAADDFSLGPGGPYAVEAAMHAQTSKEHPQELGRMQV